MPRGYQGKVVVVRPERRASLAVLPLQQALPPAALALAEASTSDSPIAPQKALEAWTKRAQAMEVGLDAEVPVFSHLAGFCARTRRDGTPSTSRRRCGHALWGRGCAGASNLRDTGQRGRSDPFPDLVCRDRPIRTDRGRSTDLHTRILGRALDPATSIGQHLRMRWFDMTRGDDLRSARTFSTADLAIAASPALSDIAERTTSKS